MTRERAADYDSKRSLILERAAQLFAQTGFDTTTMMDVARACDASKSHLYHYFASKEDLLFEIVHEHTRELLGEIKAIVAESGSAQARFARFVDAFVQRAARSRHEHLVLTTSLKYLPTERRERVQSMEAEIVNQLIELLRLINPERMAAREVRGPYAFLMFGMLIWTFTWYNREGAVSTQALAQMMTDLFMNGFRHPPSTTAPAPASASTRP